MYKTVDQILMHRIFFSFLNRGLPGLTSYFCTCTQNRKKCDTMFNRATGIVLLIFFMYACPKINLSLVVQNSRHDSLTVYNSLVPSQYFVHIQNFYGTFLFPQVEEQKKEKANRKDHWLCKGIVVKVMFKRLGDKYYKKKAYVKVGE